ncbi:MAG: hypothetical protein IIB36_06555 [Gemmatimonadetes bacterium]|nr:hypothetical protein [Gemmatimonadota bacterium]
MSPNPTSKALSTMREHGVQALLMGGQACVLYGAAEFSRDTDFAVLASPENLACLQSAMGHLNAAVIAVPPFDISYLERGHAVHFRSQHPEAMGLRIDVMTRMRGVDEFDVLWNRRTTFDLTGLGAVETLALEDLVASKKTQRDKDWPMLRRLVEAHYHQNYASPTPPQIEFWFRELRTPEILVESAARFPDEIRDLASERPLLHEVLSGDLDHIRAQLNAEEVLVRTLDRAYWAPLKAELEELGGVGRAEAYG